VLRTHCYQGRGEKGNKELTKGGLFGTVSNVRPNTQSSDKKSRRKKMLHNGRGEAKGRGKQKKLLGKAGLWENHFAFKIGDRAKKKGGSHKGAKQCWGT